MATTTKRKTAKKKAVVNKLNVAYVWDMSGSMSACTHGTIEGTRSYLADLHKQEGELVDEHGEGVYTRFSLTCFDTVFEQWVIDEPVAEVALARLDGYIPRGGTALYDAIANTITDLDVRLKGGDRDDERVLVVVMTDGGENSSKEYAVQANGRERLNKLIKRYEKKGNWTFVWLGSGLDAMKEAANVGIATGNTAAFDHANHWSYAAVSDSLGNVTRSRRSGSAMLSSTAFADAGEGLDYVNVPKSGEVLDEVKKARKK